MVKSLASLAQKLSFWTRQDFCYNLGACINVYLGAGICSTQIWQSVLSE